MPKSSIEITTAEDMLKRILHMLEESQERSISGNGTSNECRIYTNKELMKLLGVESRYLKNLRDNGYLSSSRHGDKFWYTQNDVDIFLDASSMKPLPVEELRYEVHSQDCRRQILYRHQRFYSEFIIILMN